MAALHIREGDGPAQTFPLRKGRISVGKMPDNDLVLDRSNISRRHCQIFREGGRFFLRDLASRNGTFLDGKRVATDVPLADGATIQLGDFTLRYAEGDAVVPADADGPRTIAAPAPRAAAAEHRTPPELKRKIHMRLIEELDLKHTEFTEATEQQMREKASRVIAGIVDRFADEIPAWRTKGDLVREVLDEALGLGPLEDLLADPEVDEIMVNNWDRIYVERRGRIEPTNYQFTDNTQVMNVIRRIVSPLGRRVDEASPMVDARLPDGSRVNAIIPPLSLRGPTLTIRKFSQDPFASEDLVRFGTLTPPMVRFLELAVGSRQNILISGGTGSGKTTLLNVVSSFLGKEERIVTIEDAAELKLWQDHVVSLEARPPNIEGEGAIPIRKLLINALRMRPDRILVGECRGGEALDMLQAMNTGHDGSLTTLHANTPRDALARLETLVLMAGMEIPARSIRQQIVSAIQLVVQIARMSDGVRRCTSIQEITGMEGDVVTMQEVFVFKEQGVGPGGKVLGVHQATGAIPKFVHRLRQAGREVDLTLFKA